MTDAAIDKIIAELNVSIRTVYECAKKKITASCGPNMVPRQEVVLECTREAMQCAKRYQEYIAEIERSRRPQSFIITNTQCMKFERQ